MRPLWSGVVAFGLVNIPVRLYSPAKEESLDLDYLHAKDLSPVRYARVCREEEKEIDWKDIVHGFKIDGRYVVIDKADFAKANARKTSAIELVHFTEDGTIDPMLFDKPYYLEPDKKAVKAYGLLRAALKRTGMIGIATFVLRSREHVAVLRVQGDVIVLHQLRYASEIVSSSELDLPEDAKIPAKELAMAVDLIKKSSQPFNASVYKDAYMKELLAIIKEKSKGKVPKRRGEKARPTHMNDLMAALKKSVEARDAK